MSWLSIIEFGSSLLAGWQRIVLYGVVVLAVSAMLIGYGYSKGSERLFDYKVEQAHEATRIGRVRSVVTEKIVTKYVRTKEKAQSVTEATKKEVTKYAQTNPGFCLDAGWRWLHDAAATHTIPDASRALDGASGAPLAATALETVTDNYAACNRTADRLDALQSWVAEQSKVR